MGWITGTVRRWFAVTSGALTLVTLSLFAATNTRLWAWVAIGLLVSLVIALGWNARDAHKAMGQPQPDDRARLRTLLEAAAARLEHLPQATLAPQVIYRMYKEQVASAYTLINRSLGPKLADGFADARTQGGSSGYLSEVPLKAAFLRDLAGSVDSLPLMGDWQP